MDLEQFDQTSIDAMDWAKHFVATKKAEQWKLDDIDEGLMACWFSNYWAACEAADIIYGAAKAKALEAKVEALEKALVEIRGWREIGRADTAREKLTAIEEICDQALTQSTEPEGDEDKSHV